MGVLPDKQLLFQWARLADDDDWAEFLLGVRAAGRYRSELEKKLFVADRDVWGSSS